MGTFEYQARDQAGRRVKGQLEAPDERAVVNLMREKNLSVTSIVEIKKDKARFQSPFAPLRRRWHASCFSSSRKAVFLE